MIVVEQNAQGLLMTATIGTQAPTSADDERRTAFFEHVAHGGKVEATDWMPDEYRTAVLRFVEMHANSELMGVLPEREWLLRAPTLKRKLIGTTLSGACMGMAGAPLRWWWRTRRSSGRGWRARGF